LQITSMNNADTETKHTDLFAHLAQKHGVGVDSVRQLFSALQAGGGDRAQFSIPELGGMGQWSSGGILLIGEMFNDGLKAKVADLCSELSVIAREHVNDKQNSSKGQHQGDEHAGSNESWYPSDLGTPSSSGAQNSMRYAFFPSTRRLAINDGKQTTLYDTAEHLISGVSQQQGGGQDLACSSQNGPIELSKLQKLSTKIIGTSIDCYIPRRIKLHRSTLVAKWKTK